MKKFYLSFLLIGATAGTALFAQRQAVPSGVTHQLNLPSTERPNAPGCDTINFPVPASWTMTYYVTGTAGAGGFVSGNNNYGDLQKADLYDVSSTANTFLTKAWIAFAKAHSPVLSKTVPINVYDGTTGTPGALLGTVTKTIGDIRTNVLAGNYTEVIFNPAISLPASKKFFLSVDVSNATWPVDSLVVYTNQDNQSTNTAYEQWDNGVWYAYNSASAWGLDVSHIMHPFVSTNATCALLPVTLSQFEGKRVGSTAKLSWTTLTELNNAGFELERSIDGFNFSSLQFIASKATGGNSSNAISYSFDDVKPFRGSNYYRLKQVDKDGNSSYSNVVMLKGDKVSDIQLVSVYPNPAVNMLNVSVTSPASAKVNLVITDLAGKVVAQHAQQLVSGDNNISLNVSGIPSGNYFIKGVCANDCVTGTLKFVKR